MCLITVALVVIFLMPCLGHAQTTSKPNILFILVDDLEWADTGAFGSDFYDTPNIDKLAADSAPPGTEAPQQTGADLSKPSGVACCCLGAMLKRVA